MVAAQRLTFEISSREKFAFIQDSRPAKGLGIPAKAVMPEKIFAGRPEWPAFSAERKTIFFRSLCTSLNGYCKLLIGPRGLETVESAPDVTDATNSLIH